MKTKNIDFEIKQVSDEGTFEGYVSTFDNVDLVGDVMVKGAFKKTLRDRKGKIRLLWQHDRNTPIGVFETLKEDSKGLYVKARLAMNTQKGKEAHELLKLGAMDSMSIGYSTIIEEYDREKNLNYLKEVKLFEGSLVTFPANESATVSDVKQDADEETIFSNLNNEEKKKVLIFLKSLKNDASLHSDEPTDNSTDSVDGTTKDDDTSLRGHSKESEADKKDDDSRKDEELLHYLNKIQKQLKGE